MRDMAGKNWRQSIPTIVQLQDFLPEILWPRNQVRADAEDVRQDEILRLPISQWMGHMLGLGFENRLEMLCANLSDDAIAEFVKQVGKAEADAATRA